MTVDTILPTDLTRLTQAFTSFQHIFQSAYGWTTLVTLFEYLGMSQIAVQMANK